MFDMDQIVFHASLHITLVVANDGSEVLQLLGRLGSPHVQLRGAGHLKQFRMYARFLSENIATLLCTNMYLCN
jgi:hypothetical protein